jgi:hypothetical protein
MQSYSKGSVGPFIPIHYKLGQSLVSVAILLEQEGFGPITIASILLRFLATIYKRVFSITSLRSNQFPFLGTVEEDKC